MPSKYAKKAPPKPQNQQAAQSPWKLAALTAKQKEHCSNCGYVRGGVNTARKHYTCRCGGVYQPLISTRTASSL